MPTGFQLGLVRIYQAKVPFPAQNLVTSAIDIDAKKYLRENLDDVIHLQKLSESLLELNRELKTDQYVKVKVSDVIEAATKEILPIANAKNIQLDIHNKSTRVVMGDSLMLQRAMVAVIDNAIKYSQKNSTVEIGSESTIKRIQILIRDHGMGIKKSELAHITDRFYRSDMARTKGGYGLGLSIAQQIVHKHGGELSIKSRLGSGTTVIMTLATVS